MSRPSKAQQAQQGATAPLNDPEALGTMLRSCGCCAPKKHPMEEIASKGATIGFVFTRLACSARKKGRNIRNIRNTLVITAYSDGTKAQQSATKRNTVSL
jgi:hypothetical protein